MTEKAKPLYRVLVGCNYAGKRREPGDVVDDVPPAVVGAWKRERVIEPYEPQAEPKGKK